MWSQFVRSVPACLVLAFLLASCGSEPKQANPEPAAQGETSKPKDETRRFPVTDQVDTKVIGNHLLGKSFMPGGTVAHYKHGKTEYDMFVAEFPTATDAAIAMANWDGALQSPQLVPSFGGYVGTDAGRPLFVFPKDKWVAGIVGLPQKDADLQARTLAARLN